MVGRRGECGLITNIDVKICDHVAVGNNFDTGTKAQSATSDDVNQNKEGTESKITWADVVKGNCQSAREICAESDTRKGPARKLAPVKKLITKN